MTGVSGVIGVPGVLVLGVLPPGVVPGVFPGVAGVMTTEAGAKVGVTSSVGGGGGGSTRGVEVMKRASLTR